MQSRKSCSCKFRVRAMCRGHLDETRLCASRCRFAWPRRLRRCRPPHLFFQLPRYRLFACLPIHVLLFAAGTLFVVSLSQNTRSHSCRHRLTNTSTGLMLIFPSTARVPPRSVMVVLGVSRMPCVNQACRDSNLLKCGRRFEG